MDLAFGVKHGMHLFYSTKLDFPGPRMMFAGSFMDGIAPSPTARICTFANNQHDLSGLSGQLRDTPLSSVPGAQKAWVITAEMLPAKMVMMVISATEIVAGPAKMVI